MKKILVLIILVMVAALLAVSVYAQELKAVPQSMQPQAPETITITCPATLEVRNECRGFPPSGWVSLAGCVNNYTFNLGHVEIFQNKLTCAYKSYEPGRLSWSYIEKEQNPGYRCEVNPANNGFVCKKIKSIEEKQQPKKPKH